MENVRALPKRARLRITRRNAEAIVWSAVRPDGAKHFDAIEWDTHGLTFNFRHPELEGDQKVTVYPKRDGTIEVIR